MIDGGFTPVALPRKIPDIVARELEVAGVSAVVRWPPTSGPMERVWQAPVFLRLYSQPPARKGLRTEMPSQWLHEAARWVIGGAPVDRRAMCSLQAVEFMASYRDIGSLLADWER